MLELINLPLDDELIEQYGGIVGINQLLEQTGCHSVEWIWGGRAVHSELPKSMTRGYHLTFFSDWLDFYRGDEERLKAKFGDEKTIETIYGSLDKNILLQKYREDLARAIELGSQYVVFHISDVSIEEGYSYEREHSDEEVLDASIELINRLLENFPPTIDFLVENLWWSGFRFTEPQKTKYLLDGISYKKKGIMLDTGHLMNTNLHLRNEEEGIDYILRMLERHGEYADYVNGFHLNKSLSGEYVKQTIGKLPVPSGNYFERFAKSYLHILQIDRHEPFTDKKIVQLLEKVQPKYVVHELKGGSLEKKAEAIAIQREAIKGYIRSL